jgi:hypothetical protein
MSAENSVTPSGIELMTFQLEVQCLDKLGHLVPHRVEKYYEN